MIAKGAKVAKGTKKATEPVLAYEAKLWQMADALRNNMDAAEYKRFASVASNSPSALGVRRP